MKFFNYWGSNFHNFVSKKASVTRYSKISKGIHFSLQEYSSIYRSSFYILTSLFELLRKWKIAIVPMYTYIYSHLNTCRDFDNMVSLAIDERHCWGSTSSHLSTDWTSSLFLQYLVPIYVVSEFRFIELSEFSFIFSLKV